MSDPEADSPSPRSEPQIPEGPRRLAGSVTLRELEERDRRLRLQAKQAERRHRTLSLVAGALILGGALWLGVSWRQLNARFYRAEVNLKVIRIELEAQLTEVHRYAPLTGQIWGSSQSKVEDMRADLSSKDLKERVRGIHAVQSVLKARMPLAKARVRSEWGPLYPSFKERLDQGTAAIRQRTARYNKAASEYNRFVQGFPANLVRSLFGYPDRLPPLN